MRAKEYVILLLRVLVLETTTVLSARCHGVRCVQ